MLARTLAARHPVRGISFERLYPGFLFPGRTQFDPSATSLVAADPLFARWQLYDYRLLPASICRNAATALNPVVLPAHDVTGDAELTGKDLGRDAAAGKATVVALLGVAASRRRLEQLRSSALAHLDRLDAERAELRAVFDFVISRLS